MLQFETHVAVFIFSSFTPCHMSLLQALLWFFDLVYQASTTSTVSWALILTMRPEKCTMCCSSMRPEKCLGGQGNNQALPLLLHHFTSPVRHRRNVMTSYARTMCPALDLKVEDQDWLTNADQNLNYPSSNRLKTNFTNNESTIENGIVKFQDESFTFRPQDRFR